MVRKLIVPLLPSDNSKCFTLPHACAMDQLGPLLQFSHYALLGVSKDAAADEIEAAYQSRMETLPKSRWGITLRWVLMGETGETLRAARETLLDTDLRAKYDKAIAVDQWSWLPTA